MNKDLLNILSNSNKDIDNQQLMDYLSGKLSGDELHEVERSMAGDEFLNDAVEGLQQLKRPKDMQAYVDQLNAAMQKSLEKRRTAVSAAASKTNPGPTWPLFSSSSSASWPMSSSARPSTSDPLI